MLMELAFLLRGVGADVVWITYQKPTETDEVVYSLENKMLDRGVQVRHTYELMILFILVFFAESLDSLVMCHCQNLLLLNAINS